MRGKVVSHIFWDASYSFVRLEQFYSHMVSLLHDSSEDNLSFIARLREESQRRGRDFDERRWQQHHQIYGQVYPRLFHDYFILSPCSLFEHNAKKISALVQEEHKMPFGWDVMMGPAPRRTRRYLHLAGVELSDDHSEFGQLASLFGKRKVTAAALWREIDNYVFVRNCIAHHNGLVGKETNTEGIRKYATAKGILSSDTAGRSKLSLTPEFNREVCQTMGELFQRIMSAYYGVPLPDQ